MTKIDRQSAYRLLEHQHRLNEKSASTISHILEDYDKKDKMKSLGEKTVLKRDQNPWDLYRLIDELRKHYLNRICASNSKNINNLNIFF